MSGRWLTTCAPRPRLLETDRAIGGKRSAHVSIAQVEVEPLRIEVAADPAFVVGVLGMAKISQTREEASLPVRAADILRWSCATTVDTSVNARGGLDDELESALAGLSSQLTATLSFVLAIFYMALFRLAECQSTQQP